MLFRSVIKAGNWVSISYRDIVDGTAIHAHAQSVVLLGNNDDRYGARTKAFTHMFLGEEVLNLALNLFCLLGVGAVWRSIRKRGTGNEVDAMLNPT